MKEESVTSVSKLVTTSDIIAAEPVTPGQEGPEDTKSEVAGDAKNDPKGSNASDGNGGSAFDSDNDSISDSSSETSSSDENSVYSSPDTFQSDLFEWKSKYTEATQKAKHIEEGNMKLYYLFLNQCSPGMHTEIKSTDEFKEFEMKQDGIGLLGLIREVMCWVEKHLQNTWALVQASKSLHMFWQSTTMPNDEYLTLFNARVTVLETLGGTLTVHRVLVLKKIKK